MSVRKTLCKLADIPSHGAISIDVVGISVPAELPPAPGSAASRAEVENVVVLRDEANVFAYRNVCPHAGRRLDWAPGQFLIEAGQLICAAHGATFSIQTGECISGPCRGASLTAINVSIDGANVVVGDQVLR